VAAEPLRAVIVAIGDELVCGDRTDANGGWLARRLSALGVRVLGVFILGDDVAALAPALRTAAAQADLVVVSGGLGPTTDDVTREALAAAAGVDLVHDEEAWQAIRTCLAGRDRVPAAGERRQARVPAGARWLPNETGVAPGLALQIGAARLLAFPGVPREWRSGCERHVLADLETGAESGAVGTEAIVWTAGAPESDVAARLAGGAVFERVAFASYPHDGEVELHFRATGPEAAADVAAAAAEARARLGTDVFDPPPGGRIEHAVVAALAARGWHIASAESVTGGLIARMLTRVPGASGVFPIGWVPYATQQKTAQLGVPAGLIAEHGVVSPAVAVAMAEGARERAGVEMAVATTGTAGPDPLRQPGHEPVPAGRVHVALAAAGEATQVLTLSLPHPREMVQRMAAVRALDLARRALQGAS